MSCNKKKKKKKKTAGGLKRIVVIITYRSDINTSCLADTSLKRVGSDRLGGFRGGKGERKGGGIYPHIIIS